MKALNETEMSLMRLLSQEGASTREEVARALGAPLSTVYHALSRLVAWGYVTVMKSREQGRGRPKLLYLPSRPISEMARDYLERLGAADLALAAEILGGHLTVDIRGLPEDYGVRAVSERLKHGGAFLVLADDSARLASIDALCRRRGVKTKPARRIGKDIWCMLTG